MSIPATPRLAVIGGGPAGLMAAETARAAGVEVDLYDAMGSVGRKFLLAGKGGLNLTHGEAPDRFVARYGTRQAEIGRWLAAFDAAALRAWAAELGVETFVGSSGRVFPQDLKAAPLLRRWVRRVRDAGVDFHMHHRWLGWQADGALRFATPQGERMIHAGATILALGGASWPQLGSDGGWVAPLQGAGVDIAPLQSANCGFELDWSDHLRSRFAGAPLKPVVAHWVDRHGTARSRQGEFVLSEYGIEGSLVYAIGAGLHAGGAGRPSRHAARQAQHRRLAASPRRAGRGEVRTGVRTHRPGHPCRSAGARGAIEGLAAASACAASGGRSDQHGRRRAARGAG